MRISIALPPLALVVALGGCALNAADVERMEFYGELRIDRPDLPSNVYRVTVRNMAGIGFDGDRQEDRLRLARLALKDECKRLELIDERIFPRGTYGLGRPMVDYLARLRCIND